MSSRRLRTRRRYRITLHLFGLWAAILAAVFLAGALYFRRKIAGDIAHPGRGYTVSSETQRQYLGGAVCASGRGTFTVTGSDSPELAAGAAWTATADDQRKRAEETSVGKETVLYPSETGQTRATIEVPPPLFALLWGGSLGPYRKSARTRRAARAASQGRERPATRGMGVPEAPGRDVQ